MISVLSNDTFFSFDDFVNWYPETANEHYELHNGIIIKMPKPKGKHSQIAGFLMTEFGLEIRRLSLPYFVPRECIVKGNEISGYEPDIIILDRNLVKNEPRWEKESTLIYGNTIQLVVEVVSGNWSDDYALKLDAYEILGIKEYWIVDYLGLGGRKFIGYPKQPTLTIYQLENGEYKSSQFRSSQIIQSCCFPQLTLTAETIFRAE